VDSIRDYFHACFGDTEGWLIVAIGHEPHTDENGKYAHRRWAEHPLPWPKQADKIVDAVAEQAQSADVYCCPYLRRDRNRVKGNSVARKLLHADVDSELDTTAVAALGGFAVASGTPGHAHVYVPLSYAVTRAQHEMLCRALAEHLGGDCKYSDNDLLRPAGTLNHKSAATGGEPTPVEWLVPYSGQRVDPRVVAVILGVDIAHAERERPHSGEGNYDTQPVELDEYPAVRDALAHTDDDRSAATMRIAAVCSDAGLSLEQTRYAIRTRTDLAGRLDEFAARRQPVNDLQNCWDKIAPGLAAATPATADTNGQTVAAPLDDALAVFTKWLHLTDTAPVLVTAATVVANLAAGDPVWVLLVGPPSGGKTEILSSLAGLPYIVPAATITEAALLSGTPKRERSQGATGGLLRRVGDFGILLAKDFTSVLSQNRDTARQAMAAMREIYDGSWDRNIGADGGRTLHWSGKCGFIGGVTPSYDRYVSIVNTLGDRYLLLRLPEVDPGKQALAALAQAEREKQMRAELAEAMTGLVAGADQKCVHAPLTDAESSRLVQLATFAARARTSVERDGYTKELEVIPQPEGPARLVKAMRRVYGALAAIGVDDDTRWAVLTRTAVDCAPAIRIPLMRELLARDEWTRTRDLAASVGFVTKTAGRVLDDLALLGLAAHTKKTDADNSPDLWEVSEWLHAHWPGK
jgi:hypothetical protein